MCLVQPELEACRIKTVLVLRCVEDYRLPLLSSIEWHSSRAFSLYSLVGTETYSDVMLLNLSSSTTGPRPLDFDLNDML